MARDYRREYDSYHARLDQKKDRAERNKARRMMEREGRVAKGDGKEVDHKKPIRSGGKSTRNNLRVVKPKTNRGWRGK